MSQGTERLSTALADRYQILNRLGEGGMATVYLAEDLKHKRQVAVKVLKPELAAVLGAERFVQEITTTASLQHPHILPLFDSGEADSFLYYVMPYIEGETLRSKLDRETQFGIDEAVKITSEVADALDYAHRHGVIHRDIKPENILLHDGRPMVADFGIALAVSAAAGGRMTETGLSLGTPHYMSPEQATAEKEITGASDVYSLGSVLYEMLAGEPPHMGNSAQAIIMKIVTEDAQPVNRLRKSVPPNVMAAVAKAIERVPADRFDTAKAFADALGNTAFTYGSSATMSDVGEVPPASSRRRTLIHATVTVALALALAWVLLASGPDTPAVPFHANLSDSVLPLPQGIAISPDGRTVVIAGPTTAGGLTQLYLRSADHQEFQPITGTLGATQPTFSPDGSSIAFEQTESGRGQSSYRRIPVTGGLVETIADSVRFGDWGADGTIAVVRAEGMYRIPPGGGSLELVLASDSLIINSPNVLPDGSGVLFTDDEVVSGRGLLLDLETGSVTVLFDRALNPKYVASGHIVYHAPPPSDAVMAVPFDLASHRITGPPVAVLSGVWRLAGTSHWDVSSTGTLVYVQAPDVEDSERLAWVDMAGNATLLPLQVQDMETPRVSPDVRRIAFIDFNAQVAALYDVSTGATVRLGAYFSYAWSPESRSLYASSQQGSRNAIMRLGVDGAGAPDTLITDDGLVYSVSPDGSRLVIGRVTQTRGNDIDVLRIDGASSEVAPYLRANWNERQGTLSPDGRWLAYVSDESGQNEIYARAFPDPGAPVLISDGGGVGPAWAPDGSVIYYAGPDSMTRVMVTTAQGGLQVRSQTRLFSHSGFEVTTAQFFQALGFPRRYDVDPHGDRLLMVRSLEEIFTLGVPVRVVVNWFDELRQRVGEE
jgi:serine/threonine protein kinase